MYLRIGQEGTGKEKITEAVLISEHDWEESIVLEKMG